MMMQRLHGVLNKWRRDFCTHGEGGATSGGRRNERMVQSGGGGVERLTAHGR